MNKRKWLWGIVIILTLGVCAGIIFVLPHYKLIKNDFERLEKESYNTVFFSMYPTDYYMEEDYMYYRAMQIVRTKYEIRSSRMLDTYLNKMKESSNIVTTVYLGIDPAKISLEDVLQLVQENPEMMFEVVLAYPQISYWMEMKESEYTEVFGKYQQFAEGLLGQPNARTYLFAGEDWLVCNKDNYEDVFTVNPEVSTFLMCNSDMLHPYICKTENVGEKLLEMRSLIDTSRNASIVYTDRSSYDIVFFGDSIIGNFTNSMSIPGVVKALTGANVYNCGYGGKSAALGETDDCPIPVIADAVIKADASGLPKEVQAYLGVTEFLNREDKTKKLMFVINYGLNDYFKGYPVETEAAYDICSYKGALRIAVENLKKAYPDAEILLMTPNYTTYFENGRGVQGENGGVLEEYANAAVELSKEMGVGILDNFRELPITEENWQEYLSDGCHMTEKCRFLVGCRIADWMEKKSLK